MTVAPAGPAVLEVRRVAKAYEDASGARCVLDGVDLAVARGEIVAVAGRSGSGKTTLLTLIAGLDAPDSGTIVLPGAGTGSAPPAWTEVAVLPQGLGLLGELTVRENLALPLRLADVERPYDAPDLMRALGIDHLADRLPGEISLGEQQRTALARAAIVRPRLLLADEPISHQNQAWSVAMMELLARLAADGTSCLLATHNQAAFVAAHRVLELRGGRLQGAGHAP